MSQRSHGLFVGRTRQLGRHSSPSKMGITSLIKNFDVGDKAVIMPRGNFRDIPHPRYKGRVGVVLGKRGNAYIVEVRTSKSLTVKLIVPQKYLDKVKV